MYDTLPAIVDRVEASGGDLKLDPREVFGADIPTLLSDGRLDIALCPRSSFPRDLAAKKCDASRWSPRSAQITSMQAEPTSLRSLARFPGIGPALPGQWEGFRFILGSWPWLILVYSHLETEDRVVVVTVQDARSSTAATTRRA